MKFAALLALPILLNALPASPAAFETYRVAAAVQDGSHAATGTVQAVRQATLRARISGRVGEVLVRSGDAVRVGQPLIRIEADDAVDAARASAAVASGAVARLAAARADHERAQRLRAQEYISVAAMQRIEAALRSAESDAEAATAAASEARIRAAWRTIAAPYAANVTEVFVAVGDLATADRPLIVLHDPAALRVTVRVPEPVATQLQAAGAASLVMDSGKSILRAASWAVVSAVDPLTHTVEVRLELPAGVPLRPGQFVRVLLPLKSATAVLRVPLRAVLRRSEVTAVYVVDAAGVPFLRQIRLGAVDDENVTVLSGLRDGELIALDPVAAGGR